VKKKESSKKRRKEEGKMGEDKERRGDPQFTFLAIPLAWILCVKHCGS